MGGGEWLCGPRTVGSKGITVLKKEMLHVVTRKERPIIRWCSLWRLQV